MNSIGMTLALSRCSCTVRAYVLRAGLCCASRWTLATSPVRAASCTVAPLSSSCSLSSLLLRRSSCSPAALGLRAASRPAYNSTPVRQHSERQLWLGVGSQLVKQKTAVS